MSTQEEASQALTQQSQVQQVQQVKKKQTKRQPRSTVKEMGNISLKSRQIPQAQQPHVAMKGRLQDPAVLVRTKRVAACPVSASTVPFRAEGECYLCNPDSFKGRVTKNETTQLVNEEETKKEKKPRHKLTDEEKIQRHRQQAKTWREKNKDRLNRERREKRQLLKELKRQMIQGSTEQVSSSSSNIQQIACEA